MTLNELLETNGSITTVDVTIRNNQSIKLHEIKFGKYAEEDKFPNCENKPRWDVKRVNVNHYDNGKDYFGYVKGSIPKQLENMTVTHWYLLPESHKYRTTINSIYQLYVDVLKEDAVIETSIGDGWREIEDKSINDGQISLLDFM